MKRFLCFVLVMLMCLGGQALATPQWQNAEPVKAEDLPEGRAGGAAGDESQCQYPDAAGLAAPGGAADPARAGAPARTMQP